MLDPIVRLVLLPAFACEIGERHYYHRSVVPQHEHRTWTKEVAYAVTVAVLFV